MLGYKNRPHLFPQEVLTSEGKPSQRQECGVTGALLCADSIRICPHPSHPDPGETPLPEIHVNSSTGGHRLRRGFKILKAVKVMRGEDKGLRQTGVAWFPPLSQL